MARMLCHVVEISKLSTHWKDVFGQELNISFDKLMLCSNARKRQRSLTWRHQGLSGVLGLGFLIFSFCLPLIITLGNAMDLCLGLLGPTPTKKIWGMLNFKHANNP